MLFLKPSKRTLERLPKSLAERNRRAADDPWDLIGGISRELEVRKPDALLDDLIGADGQRRFEAGGAATGHVVGLIHPVAANPESTHEPAASVENGLPGGGYCADPGRIVTPPLHS